MAGTDGPGLEDRVRRLEDLQEIRRLALDYARTLDGKDFDACSKLFARDGEFVLPFESSFGPAAIERSMTGMLGKDLAAVPGRDFHVLANERIELDGDRATARSFWIYVTPGADEHPRIAQFGHYEDELVREDGRWRFARRDAARDVGVPQAGVPGVDPDVPLPA
jgi:uncharacterized protein (TIGR02246 family)